MSIRTLALIGLIGSYSAAAHACIDEQVFDECLWMCTTSQSALARALSGMTEGQRPRFAGD